MYSYKLISLTCLSPPACSPLLSALSYCLHLLSLLTCLHCLGKMRLPLCTSAYTLQPAEEEHSCPLLSMHLPLRLLPLTRSPAYLWEEGRRRRLSRQACLSSPACLSLSHSPLCLLSLSPLLPACALPLLSASLSAWRRMGRMEAGLLYLSLSLSGRKEGRRLSAMLSP